MRQGMALISLIIIWSLVIGHWSFSATAQSNPYDFQVKKVYTQPDENSELVYNIPIEVKLLDISEDANWYKVKIAFDLGILGKHRYEGWVPIPVGDILAARQVQKLAIKK